MDAQIPVGTDIKLRLIDQGDGTHAEVLSTASSTAPADGDQLITIGDGIKIRMRDMGDGSHARTIHKA